jgi:four helix bundle protein
MQDFRKLLVWQEAQTLAVAVHGATAALSGAERAGYRSQLRRSASSIAANIAEGSSAGGATQFARYLQMAIASSTETESHLDLGVRLRYLGPEIAATLMADTVRLRRRTIALRKRVVEASRTKPPEYSEPRNPNPELRD